MSTTTTETIALPYIQVPETSECLDWADLATLDLSKFDQPGGKEELAAEFLKANEEIGFFYVKNHGLSRDEVDTQFALGKSVLSLPEETRLEYRADLEAGDYNGWKPVGTRDLIPGVKDNFEIYNIPKFIPEHSNRAHPDIIKRYLTTIERFSKHVHEKIVNKLLVVFAIALQLEDEEWLLKRHRYEKSSGDHLRYMKYHARGDQENQKLGNVWLKGHSDMGSLTLLFRQPVAALQILAKDGIWKWVQPQTDALTVNIADALSFLTNGYFKSSIHRVVAPPTDQAHVDRLGVIYMVRLEDDTDLVPIHESRVLREKGLLEENSLGSDGQPIKAGEWVKQRVIKQLGQTSSDKGDYARTDVEVVKGVKSKYYN